MCDGDGTGVKELLIKYSYAAAQAWAVYHVLFPRKITKEFEMHRLENFAEWIVSALLNF